MTNFSELRRDETLIFFNPPAGSKEPRQKTSKIHLIRYGLKIYILFFKKTAAQFVELLFYAMQKNLVKMIKTLTNRAKLVYNYYSQTFPTGTED